VREIARTLALVAVFIMASPQPDQFTKLSSELLDAMCFLQLSGSEWSFVHAVIRKTYGYNKKEDWVTNTQIMAMTGLGKERVSEAKKKLLELNIVTEKRNKISIQKDYEKWGQLRKNVTGVTEKRNSELRKNVTTIDSIDNIQKTTGESADSQGLSDNQNNMAWHRQPDDFEEIVLDLDSGEIKTPEKKSTRKYPNAPAVRKVFLEVLGKNPAAWAQHTTQLQASENLFTERGIDQIRKALEFYQENKDREFCPQTTSPHELDTKWSKLIAYKNKS
jgi:phage replication O-like protein O